MCVFQTEVEVPEARLVDCAARVRADVANFVDIAETEVAAHSQERVLRDRRRQLGWGELCDRGDTRALV